MWSDTLQGTHVNLQGDVVHKQGSNARALHKMCPTLLQASNDSNNPPKPCTPVTHVGTSYTCKV
jgi:hypothetical protein